VNRSEKRPKLANTDLTIASEIEADTSPGECEEARKKRTRIKRKNVKKSYRCGRDVLGRRKTVNKKER